MTVDDKAHQRMAALFDARLPDRMKSLAQEKSRMMRKAKINGSCRGSHVKGSLHQLCAQELDILTAWAWQDIRRVVLSLPTETTDALADDLKGELRALLLKPYAEIKKTYEHWMTIEGDSPMRLEPAVENAYKKIDAEIDVFVDGLTVGTVRPGGLHSIIVQGNAQVGAIVASPGASAHVTQQNISDNRQLLLDTLDRVLSAIRESSHDSELSEARELVEEAKAEIGKHRVNVLKLSGAFTAIGTAIGMLADLRPAYESLKHAAAILGITLP